MPLNNTNPEQVRIRTKPAASRTRSNSHKTPGFLLLCCGLGLLNLILPLQNHAAPAQKAGHETFADLSPNHEIRLTKIKLQGRGLLRRSTFSRVSGIKAGDTLHIREIRQGLEQFKQSGLLEEDSAFASSLSRQADTSRPDADSEKGYILSVQFRERGRLTQIRVEDEAFMNMEILRVYLDNFHVKNGRVFSPSFVRKALDEFTHYYQLQGIFLFETDFVVTPAESSSSADRSIPEELNLIIRIRKLDRVQISHIKMSGCTNVRYQVLRDNFFRFQEGSTVSENGPFASTFDTLRRLGYFSRVFFRFIRSGKNKERFILRIEVRELDVSKLHFYNEAPSNIGLIVYGEYFDFAAFSELDRFVVNLGYEVNTEHLNWTIRYTKPKAWNDFFFDAIFHRYTDIAPNLSSTDDPGQSYDLLLSQNKLSFTFGYDLTRNLSTYLIFSASYFQENRLFYSADESLLRKENIDNYWQYDVKLLWGYNNLNDNFNPTSGMKIYASYTPYFGSEGISHRFDTQGEAYLTDYQSIIVAFNARFSYLFPAGSMNAGLTAYRNLRLSVMQAQIESSEGLKATFYSAADFRYSLGSLLNGLFAVAFTEIGGMWPKIRDMSYKDFQYGIGLGLRYSPVEYSGAFFLDYPAGLYFGFKLGQPDEAPQLSLLTHRDKYYYINLSVSF